MSKFPTFNELYDEFRAQVEADSNHKLRDFSPGSRLDAYAATAASAAQSIMRYINQQISSFFLLTSVGASLDFIIEDQFIHEKWLRRLPEEADDALRQRVLEYLEIKSRGTLPSLLYFLQVVKKDTLKDTQVIENINDGSLHIMGTWKTGVDITLETQKLKKEIQYWRPAGALLHWELNQP